jgi:hypothetical protein
MSYCTVHEVKAHLGVEDDADDYIIGGFVAAAQSAIDSKCNRTFEAIADTTRRFDAVRDVTTTTRTLWLDHDLCQITTVTNDADGLAEVIPSTGYTTSPRNDAPYFAIKLKSDYSWTWSDEPEDAIAITGRWAYSVTAPAAIKTACIMLASFYYRQKDVPFTDVTAVEAGVVVRPVGIPAAIMPILTPYIKL